MRRQVVSWPQLESERHTASYAMQRRDLRLETQTVIPDTIREQIASIRADNRIPPTSRDQITETMEKMLIVIVAAQRYGNRPCAKTLDELIAKLNAP